ncbi:hypothetical protein K523DRAFT_409763, partial [Schizophyllum commune Tattone D]
RSLQSVRVVGSIHPPFPLPSPSPVTVENCLRGGFPRRGRCVTRIRVPSSVHRARSRPQLARAACRTVAWRASRAPRPTPLTRPSTGGTGALRLRPPAPVCAP